MLLVARQALSFIIDGHPKWRGLFQWGLHNQVARVKPIVCFITRVSWLFSSCIRRMRMRVWRLEDKTERAWLHLNCSLYRFFVKLSDLNNWRTCLYLGLSRRHHRLNHFSNIDLFRASTVFVFFSSIHRCHVQLPLLPTKVLCYVKLQVDVKQWWTIRPLLLFKSTRQSCLLLRSMALCYGFRWRRLRWIALIYRGWLLHLLLSHRICHSLRRLLRLFGLAIAWISASAEHHASDALQQGLAIKVVAWRWLGLLLLNSCGSGSCSSLVIWRLGLLLISILGWRWACGTSCRFVTHCWCIERVQFQSLEDDVLSFQKNELEMKTSGHLHLTRPSIEQV